MGADDCEGSIRAKVFAGTERGTVEGEKLGLVFSRQDLH